MKRSWLDSPRGKHAGEGPLTKSPQDRASLGAAYPVRPCMRVAGRPFLWSNNYGLLGRCLRAKVPLNLKHDVAYGSLQKFAGGDAVAPLGNDPDGDELDEAWNPRNKALADEKLRADIRRHGCQDQSGTLAAIMCLLASEETIANRYFDAVAKVNHKGWPVTNADINDFASNFEFEVCNEPVVPTVSGLTVKIRGYNNRQLGLRSRLCFHWSCRRGCSV